MVAMRSPNIMFVLVEAVCIADQVLWPDAFPPGDNLVVVKRLRAASNSLRLLAMRSHMT
jgi:hypothetical protein